MSPRSFVVLHDRPDAAAALWVSDLLSRHPSVSVATEPAAADGTAKVHGFPLSIDDGARNRSGSRWDAPFDRVILLSWRSRLARVAHRLRREAGLQPPALGGGQLSVSLSSLSVAVDLEAARERVGLALARRLLSNVLVEKRLLVLRVETLVRALPTVPHCQAEVCALSRHA